MCLATDIYPLIELYNRKFINYSLTINVCLQVKCHPEPDAFNPCEDLMGNWALRIPVWFISLSAIIGNLLVVVVIVTSHFRLTVSKFLMVNLAIADLCIGIHLFLIAIVDSCSIGFYFNYAIYWQRGMSALLILLLFYTELCRYLRKTI